MKCYSCARWTCENVCATHEDEDEWYEKLLFSDGGAQARYKYISYVRLSTDTKDFGQVT